MARINLHNLVAWLYVRENICVLFKSAEAWSEQKNAISWIICMTPQRYAILKNLLNPACLYTPLGKGTREWRFLFHSACPPRCAVRGGKNGEVRFPR